MIEFEKALVTVLLAAYLSFLFASALSFVFGGSLGKHVAAEDKIVH